PHVGAIARPSALKWQFPTGAYAVMRSLKLESSVLDWQGTELVYVSMDELTHFTEFMFWYITSRMRSTSGIKPYFRGTCNPTTFDDPVGGWVRGLVEWWIGEDGYPIPERAGVVRHFIRDGEELKWFDEPQLDGLGQVESKSFTFIPATVYDNPALLKKDPSYLATLKSLPQVERDRLLGGNWNVKAVAGKVFKDVWFTYTTETFRGGDRVRFWDLAASEMQKKGDDPDWTVGTLMQRHGDRFIVLDVVQTRSTPAGVDALMIETAARDGAGVSQRWFRDPGQAGIYQDRGLRKLLTGFDAAGVLDPMGKKLRVNPLSAAVESGEVIFQVGSWNRPTTNQLIQFPDGAHDDHADSMAGAYNLLSGAYGKGFKSSEART
ncbi:MAG: phage terminase large subunit, partial [Elainellaceae cyanobacterium]